MISQSSIEFIFLLEKHISFVRWEIKVNRILWEVHIQHIDEFRCKIVFPVDFTKDTVNFLWWINRSWVRIKECHILLNKLCFPSTATLDLLQHKSFHFAGILKFKWHIDKHIRNFLGEDAGNLAQHRRSWHTRVDDDFSTFFGCRIDENYLSMCSNQGIFSQKINELVKLADDIFDEFLLSHRDATKQILETYCCAHFSGDFL